MTVERTHAGHQTRYELRGDSGLACVVTYTADPDEPAVWKVLLPGPGGTEDLYGAQRFPDPGPAQLSAAVQRPAPQPEQGVETGRVAEGDPRHLQDQRRVLLDRAGAELVELRGGEQVELPGRRDDGQAFTGFGDFEAQLLAHGWVLSRG